MKASAAWKKKRAQVIERDGGACCNCGETQKRLDVHHRYYEAGRKDWDYELASLELLCPPCHGDADAMRRRLVKAIGLLPSFEDQRLLGYLEGRIALVGRHQIGLLCVDNEERSDGIALATGLSKAEIIEAASLSRDRTVDVAALCLAAYERSIRR